MGEPSRRQALRLGAAALAAWPTWAAARSDRGALRFRLTETAGLRRFGYPVHAILPEPRVGVHFRLERDGKAVPAQFRAVDGPDGGTAIALDFVASPGPLETAVYQVVHGDDLEPGPEPKQRLRVEPIAGAFRITNGPAQRYDVPTDLLGFLAGVGGQLEYLKRGSEGLTIRDRDGGAHRLGGASARASVARQGPLAVMLRFDSTAGPAGGPPVAWSVTMTIPSSKSWVETTWTIDDPEGLIAGMGFGLGLSVGEGPTLVDLGAGPGVYARLKAGERIVLEAGEAAGFPPIRGGWEVRQGPGEALEPIALPPYRGAVPAEGWAHVMDRSRCTAAALADFGASSRDRIEVDADGHVRIDRAFAAPGAAPRSGTKSWTSWHHFVPTPVQVGAATSPRAMLNPLRLDWSDPPG